jgi:hypothetical protein
VVVLALDPQTHGPGGAGDLELGGVEVVGVEAISAIWASVTVPAPSRPGVCEPFSIPAAWRSSTGVGGVLRMNVKLRSSKIVISTGTIVPRWASVAAL